MIKHIVLWTLKDRSKAGVMKAALEALPTTIPAIRSFEVGIGAVPGAMQADIALVSAFDSETDLQAYVVHPDHQEVAELIRDLAVERRVIDYVV